MSTALEKAKSTMSDDSEPVQYTNPDGSPNVDLLTDRSPEWMRMTRSSVILTAILGAFFVHLNFFIPVWHTDLWGHLSYGRWIAENGALPKTEPLMPLSRGVDILDTAWLSQLTGYFAYDYAGIAGIKFIYALSIVIAVGLITCAIYRRTRSIVAAITSLGAFYWIDYQQLLIVRPQLAGLACFAALMVMATSVQWRQWYYVAIPMLFAVWANMHGSFIVGILALGALMTGRAIDLYRRTGNLKMIFAETRTRQLFYALELAAVAVLLNPYGIAIYGEVFAISGHANLANLIEWEPLTFRMKQGQAMAAVAMALIVCYRLTPRRVTAGEVLLLCGLGGAAMWTSRMIVWWAPIAAYYLGLHFAAILRAKYGTPAEGERRGASFVAIVGIAWICLAITPLASVVRSGLPDDPKVAEATLRRNVSLLTPINAVNYLNEYPPVGQVFNTYEWGDYLLWAGPKNIEVFTASHAHLIPEEVWNDSLLIQSGASNWHSKLDRYGVNTIIVDQQRRGDFIGALEAKSDIWDKAYADNVSAVFKRRNPI